MSLTDAQRAFLEAFILKPAGNTTPPDSDLDPLKIWTSAKERTDQGISALQVAMKSYKHPDLDNIADKGLNGITNGNQTAMMRALMEFKAAAPADRAKQADALAKQVKAYRGFLDENRIITLCEKNPFGVSVTIRAPLNAALDQIATITAR